MAIYRFSDAGISAVDSTPVVKENPSDVAILQGGEVAEMREGPKAPDTVAHTAEHTPSLPDLSS